MKKVFLKFSMICSISILSSCGGGQSGQTITNTTSSTAANVSYVTAPSSLSRRTMPTIYSNPKAISYSPYRTGEAPGGVTPTVSEIDQDLSLLNSTGFNLIRLFGADSVTTTIIQEAEKNYPNLKFQLGIYLIGASGNCQNTNNNDQIQTAINLAKQYNNVITVSVGNETSFAQNLTTECLASYIYYVKQNVNQPITADDDYTYYSGVTNSASLNNKPDRILPLIDFASIHTYPFSNSQSWPSTSQTSATNLMNLAESVAQGNYENVFNYSYLENGTQKTIGTAMPIIIGETGWKAKVTNTSNSLELLAANPINQKWYFDLMNSWQTSNVNGSFVSTPNPKAIIWFEAFDEPWKGVDDGWGLWDVNRSPRYALCGTSAPSSITCTNPIYTGATY